MLKKIRNVLMIMMGFCLLGPTYIIYFDTHSQQHKEYWQERLGDWYETFPYFSIPVGALLILFALVGALTIALGNSRKPLD